MSENDELPILYARDECGTYRFIEDVPNGDACGCFCPACGQPMRARNAGVKRRHSFAHQPGATCTWGVEAVVTALSKKAIEDVGMIVLPSLSYRNAVSNEMQLETEEMQMEVVKVEEIMVVGRQAPGLIVTVTRGSSTARFALCVTLRRKPSPEQVDELSKNVRGVILVDLGLDLKQKRKELGKHYDRDEVIKEYQDEDFLASILTETGSTLASWEMNRRRDQREADSVIEKERIEREEDEKRRAVEEARKKRDEVERRRRAEREAKEEREGIVREPDNYVTEADEYDVRNWPSETPLGARLAPNERLARNGGLLALVTTGDNRDSLGIYAEMTADAICEVAWKLDDLSRNYDKFMLVLSATEPQNRLDIVVNEGMGVHAEMLVHRNSRYFCCALQALVVRGTDMIVNTANKQSWNIDSVDVKRARITLRKRGRQDR